MSIQLKTQVTGTLLSLLPKIEAAAVIAVKQGADEFEALAKIEAKGSIKDTIHQLEVTPLWRIVYAEGIIPVVMEFGSEPHLIVPKTPGGVLHWTDSAGGDVFVKWVNHPGTPPRPWMGPAALHFGPLFRQIVLMEIREAIAA